VNLRLILIRLAIFTAGIGFIIGVLVFSYAYFTVGIPDPNKFVNSQSTIIEYADGQEIGRIGSENRKILSLAAIPLNVRHAVLAAEDRNFYNESAISPTGILRALFNNLKGGSLQGGSTITQQYAKTAFLTQDRTITRKIKELVISIKLGNQISKDQILENYLNTIWFGRGAYGVETASEVFFGKTVNELSISQAAVLAAVLRSPGFYDPSYGAGNMERLQARWRYVIDGMVSEKWITKDQAARTKFPDLKPRVKSGDLAGPKGYAISWAVHEVQKLGLTEDQLQTGGFVIKTTLEKKNQEAAYDAVAKGTPKAAPPNLRIGLVSIRPGTGEVVALYGGQDYLVSQLNSATQGITQAGSSFKPFTLVAALEAGIPLSSQWDGHSPKVFDDLGKPYPVFNYGNEQYGTIDLLTATAHSVNTIFVPLGIKAGPDKVVDVIRRAGIPTTVALLATPSITLGVASPHVIDMASAYATFAANGVYAKPYMIKEVSGPSGNLIYQATQSTSQVFNQDVVADLDNALQQVTAYGTGVAAGVGLNRPVAGKTGTTTDNASAWFNGYVPQLATSVAMFRDDATQTLNGIGGLNSVTGGSFPARIWNIYYRAAMKGEPIEQFPAPANIGGTDPISYTDAIPTLDPELAVSATPTTKKPIPKYTVSASPSPTPTKKK
jgi:membrane peptidoglycan carboxypeptidase